MTAGRKSRPTCVTSSGWIATMSGALVSSQTSKMPLIIEKSLMLKAGTANWCARATWRRLTPLTSMGVSLSSVVLWWVTAEGPPGHGSSALHRSGRHAADEELLEEDEEGEDRDRAQHA